jgi:hypothetical protein
MKILLQAAADELAARSKRQTAYEECILASGDLPMKVPFQSRAEIGHMTPLDKRRNVVDSARLSGEHLSLRCSVADPMKLRLQAPPPACNEPMKVIMQPTPEKIKQMAEPMKIPAPTHLTGDILFTRAHWDAWCHVVAASDESAESTQSGGLSHKDETFSTASWTATEFSEFKDAVVSEKDDQDSTEISSDIQDQKSDSVDQIDASEEMPANAGSLGHPDFCARPCLYFAMGKCANGTSCEFCHLDHDRKDVHLDKRNRLSLGRLSFTERASFILPIIASRAQQLGLTQSLEGINQLQSQTAEQQSTEEQAAATALTSREGKKLRHILRGLRVQELFRRLKAKDAPSSVQLLIDAVSSQMHEEGSMISEQQRI